MNRKTLLIVLTVGHCGRRVGLQQCVANHYYLDSASGKPGN